MTYCLGIKTEAGLVLASDSRTNAGIDHVDTCRKMHTFVTPGERLFVILSSGSLSITQSVITLLDEEFARRQGLASAANFYAAARCVGGHVRKVAELDRTALERDGISFNINLIVGGQIRGEEHHLYLIYPQGNPLRATVESPFLQIGESKYGRPILDRGVRHHETTLEEATKYALLSIDSTMRSNMAVGPPIDIVAYAPDEFDLRRRARLTASDTRLTELRSHWESELRRVIQTLPSVKLP
ncbi:MAG: peptidase [Planctomycetia bacterium]|nr:peptidase [Planctomycetia bacterium]